jgi:signal transduction histidine kinase
VAEEKSIISDSKRLSFTRGLTFKTLIPLVIIIFLVIGAFGSYISTKTKEDSKEFLIQNMLMPEFQLLAKEKNSDFERIKNLTEYTAKKIEDRIAASKNRTGEDLDILFTKYVSKKPDGSYRSELDETRGRFQMAAFHNSIGGIDIREKGIFADAFLFFDPFGESQMPFVFTTYFATKNSIWQYGFPDWALTSAANETFDKYGWFYEADPEHDPDREQVWTDMYFDELQNQWMISSLMPIYDGEEFLGIVGQDFTLQKIIENTKKSKIGESGILFFIDNLGNIVAHPDTEFLIGKKAANDETLNLKTLSDETLVKALQNLPNESGFRLTEEKNRRIVMHYPLESVNWKMIYIVNEEEFLRIVNQANSQYLISFVLFALFDIVLIVLIINFMVIWPIKKLTEATNEISKGNLYKKINIQSKDEIGNLASAFNDMTANLKVARKHLEEHSKNLENQVQERTEDLSKKMKELEDNRAAILNMMEDVDQTNKELTQVQGNLKKSYRELKRLDQDKDTFISIAAHELKTPMTSIHGFAQLLENEKTIKDPEARNKYLKIIEHEVERLAKLVTEVLDLSRVDLGTMKFTIEDVNVCEIAEEVEAELTEKAKSKGLYLKFNLKKGLPAIQTDKERLKQILINLVDNSIKYSEKGGTTVEVDKDGDSLKFSMADRGIGIPKERQPKMFTRFYQVENPLTRKVGGSGLGLSICKEFVEALGGRIWFESHVGKGTTFYFTLPIKSKIFAANKYQKQQPDE